jgi:hypothetical protein
MAQVMAPPPVMDKGVDPFNAVTLEEASVVADPGTTVIADAPGKTVTEPATAPVLIVALLLLMLFSNVVTEADMVFAEASKVDTALSKTETAAEPFSMETDPETLGMEVMATWPVSIVAAFEFKPVT